MFPCHFLDVGTVKGNQARGTRQSFAGQSDRDVTVLRLESGKFGFVDMYGAKLD
jgi:hypothetical protein